MSIGTPKTDFFQLLLDIYEYLDNRADVDGGQPNDAMRLQQRVSNAMNELEEL